MNYDFLYSEIDTAHFGFKIGKAKNFLPSFDDLIQLKKEDYKLLIIRVENDNVAAINKLENMGFELKDIQVVQVNDLNNIPLSSSYDTKKIKIRSANEKDLVHLDEIVINSFDNYGHYSQNKLLNQTKVLELYKDWNRRAFFDKNIADEYIICEVENQVAGFYSFKKNINASEKSIYGVIGAVNSNFRNQGIFKALIKYGLNWSFQQGVSTMENNVLLSNLASNKVFSQCGFTIKSSFSTFHKWI